jgi:hypothetical protein
VTRGRTETRGDEGGLSWNWFGWVYGLANFGKAPGVKRLLRLIGRAIRLLIAPIEDLEGKGAAYTVVFRKAKH